jgi:hypothetical protein
MDREEFREIFNSALDEAFSNAERMLGISLSRNFIIELHGADHAGDHVNFSRPQRIGAA